MTCANCTQTQTKAHWPGFTAECRGCQLRALASSPTFFAATQAGAMTAAYRSALQALFAEAWREAHEEVKAEHARLQALQTRMKGG